MGYYARCSGTIMLKEMNDKEKSLLNKEMIKYASDYNLDDTEAYSAHGIKIYSPDWFVNVDMWIPEQKGNTCIDLYADDKFHEDSWNDWLQIISKYADLTYDNEVEFAGENGDLWRYLLTEDGYIEQAGRVVYD